MYWLPAALGYSLAIGASGVTIKLALRTIEWPIILLSVTVSFVVLSIFFMRDVHVPPKPGLWLVYVALSGALAAGAFPLFNVALKAGDASQVVPVSATYPVVTLVLAALFLTESLTTLRVAGVGLIVGGIVLVSR